MNDAKFYWGFRQVRLGKSFAESRLNPGIAVLQGPYSSQKEAEFASTKAAQAWDAATSLVFEAASREEAQLKVDDLTPKE